MPAKSKDQQRAAGIALQAKRNNTVDELPKNSASYQMAKSMSKKELEDLADTERKGLPKDINNEAKSLAEVFQEEMLDTDEPGEEITSKKTVNQQIKDAGFDSKNTNGLDDYDNTWDVTVNSNRFQASPGMPNNTMGTRVAEQRTIAPEPEVATEDEFEFIEDETIGPEMEDHEQAIAEPQDTPMIDDFALRMRENIINDMAEFLVYHNEQYGKDIDDWWAGDILDNFVYEYDVSKEDAEDLALAEKAKELAKEKLVDENKVDVTPAPEIPTPDFGDLDTGVNVTEAKNVYKNFKKMLKEGRNRSSRAADNLINKLVMKYKNLGVRNHEEAYQHAIDEILELEDSGKEDDYNALVVRFIPRNLRQEAIHEIAKWVTNMAWGEHQAARSKALADDAGDFFKYESSNTKNKSLVQEKINPSRWKVLAGILKEDEEKWIQGAVNEEEEGEFTAKAEAMGMGVQEYADYVLKRAREDSWKGDEETVDQAKFAKAAQSIANEAVSHEQAYDDWSLERFDDPRAIAQSEVDYQRLNDIETSIVNAVVETLKFDKERGKEISKEQAVEMAWDEIGDFFLEHGKFSPGAEMLFAAYEDKVPPGTPDNVFEFRAQDAMAEELGERAWKEAQQDGLNESINPYRWKKLAGVMTEMSDEQARRYVKRLAKKGWSWEDIEKQMKEQYGLEQYKLKDLKQVYSNEINEAMLGGVSNSSPNPGHRAKLNKV